MRQTLFNQTNREGTVTSASWTSTIEATRVELHGILNAAELADLTLTMTLLIERSRDGGANWDTVIAMDWQGGQLARDGLTFKAPYAAASQEGLLAIGDRVRGTLDLSKRVRIGLEAEIV